MFPPRDRLRNFNNLFLAATKQAKDKPLIIAGDFNAHNKAWGYSKNDGKGNKLAECAEILGLKLITDPRFPTRKGNSAQRDTTPDLAFLRNVEGSWDNLQKDLGSDHFITEINVSITQPPPRIYRYIDWDVFRDIRTKEERPRETFEDLISNLKEAVQKATKEISTELELAVPAMDSRLAHLLEAKNALRERWKRQKMNRRLRTKISELNKEIESHAKKLAALQWDEVCNEADGKMRKGSKWSLLKHLLTDGNKPSKSSARLEIERLVHMNTKHGGDPQAFADKLADIYIPLEGKSIPWNNSRPEYQGSLQSALDRPFEVAEIVHALRYLNERSAPGPDGITNKLLRNLDNAAIEVITEKINQVWSDGQVPEEWRTANSYS
ncbi:uncharacterized protein LOC119381968 [Rhipicephalus sanguineus]|uniref:uncharacterized protein LOC119381968 n=1 Tax=Rhipicephalus sanguineus TaxID=34632 RepID=UPI0018942EBD|nr:uncharacterized protein LOC119381968 [Rhipicephalus sanguineus]